MECLAVIRNDPPPPAPPPRKKINVAVLLVVAAVFVTLPLLAFAGLFLWLERTSFNSVDEINPAELEGVQLRMVNLPRGVQNRPDPLPGETLTTDENTVSQADPDIGPVKLSRPDFDVIFKPLRNAEPLDDGQWPAAPFLGEIRVRYTDGRRGTIYLYWSPAKPGDANSPAVVYMNVGSHRYRACSLKELRTFAEACAGRGSKVAR